MNTKAFVCMLCALGNVPFIFIAPYPWAMLNVFSFCYCSYTAYTCLD